jgi:hypothetical protein
VNDNTFEERHARQAGRRHPGRRLRRHPVPDPEERAGSDVEPQAAWRGASWQADFNQYQITADGKVVLTTSGTIKQTMPYYYEDGNADNFGGYFWTVNLANDGPPIRAGEMIVARARRSLQERGLRLPDRPAARAQAAQRLLRHADAGQRGPDVLRRDQRLLGPHHAVRLEAGGQEGDADPLQRKPAAAGEGCRHRQGPAPQPGPRALGAAPGVGGRGEPEAGQRHQAPKGVYYLDEDTWQAMLGDRWDANGQLWKTFWGFNYVMPEFPGVVQQTFGFYDLLSGQAYLSNILNDKSYHHKAVARWPESIFTGEGLAAQGVR